VDPIFPSRRCAENAQSSIGSNLLHPQRPRRDEGPQETHELSAGQIISIPAHEYYEGSNPHDEPMILLGNSHKATPEDVAKAGGQRNEIDDKTGKRIIYQHGGGRDEGVLAD
jgi:hypothetical protein